MKRFIAYLLLCCSMLVSAVPGQGGSSAPVCRHRARVADKLAEGYAS